MVVMVVKIADFYYSRKSFLSFSFKRTRARLRQNFLCLLKLGKSRQQEQPYLPRLFLLPSKHFFFCSLRKSSIVVFVFRVAAVVLRAAVFLRRWGQLLANALFQFAIRNCSDLVNFLFHRLLILFNFRTVSRRVSKCLAISGQPTISSSSIPL